MTRSSTTTARRARGPAPWARPARWVSLGLGVAMLAACTPATPPSSPEPSPRVEISPETSSPSTSLGVVPNPAAESDAPQGQAGATMTIDPRTGKVINDTDGTAEPGAYRGLLGLGTDAAGSLQKAHGLSWADGTAVDVSAISVPQARQATGSAAPRVTLDGSKLPDPLAAEKRRRDLSNADISFIAFQATADRVYGVVHYTLWEAGSEGQTVNHVGYVDHSGWHAGPQLQNSPLYFSPPSVVVGGRLYWLENGDPENTDFYVTWSLKSWSPGDKKVKTHLTDHSDGLPFGFTVGTYTPGSPRILSASATSLYLSGITNDFYDVGHPPADGMVILNVDLAGKKKVSVIKRASNPIATPSGLVYTAATAEPIDQNSPNGSPPSAVKLLTPSGKTSTLVTIDKAEAQRGLTDDPSEEGDVMDEDGSPMGVLPSKTPLTVLDADGESLLLRQRGQLLRLNLSEHTGTRVVPAQRQAVNPVGTAVLCSGRAYFISNITSGVDALALFSLGADGRLQWVSGSENTLSLACSGSTLMTNGMPGSLSTDESSLADLRLRALPHK